MTVRPIVTIAEDPRQVLTSDTRLVRGESRTLDLQQLILDLTETMMAHPIAIGLSANQIGVPLAVSVISLERSKQSTLALVNPEILSESGKKDVKYESCMSIPGRRGLVLRRRKLAVAYYSDNLERTLASLEGFVARAWMHEIDHLCGKLFTNHLSGDLESSNAFFYDPPRSVAYSQDQIQALTDNLSGV